eukprot:scaffold11473_cov21-Tisochrysis_lutea.AAC.1
MLVHADAGSCGCRPKQMLGHENASIPMSVCRPVDTCWVTRWIRTRGWRRMAAGTHAGTHASKHETQSADGVATAGISWGCTHCCLLAKKNTSLLAKKWRIQAPSRKAQGSA